MTALQKYLHNRAQYSLGSGFGHSGPARFDEISTGGSLRPAWESIVNGFRVIREADLVRLSRQAVRYLGDDGVIYNRIDPADQDNGPTPEPWALDVIPLVISAEEWTTLRAGLAQRMRLLKAVLADIYGDQQMLAEGIIPPEVIVGHSGYVRFARSNRDNVPQRLVLAAADLGRDADGHWTVISDRTQAPSGLAYAMENRRVMSRLLPAIHQQVQIERLWPFFNECRAAIDGAAPRSSNPPLAVVLSPGPQSETAFDQSYFASLLGYPVVEGGDLTSRDGRIWLRSAGKLDPVDVIVRRVDATWTDPLFLRGASRLGVPGLLDAARRGSVSVVNGFGSGVLENPALFPLLPRLSERLLGEEVMLPTVPTYWCGDEQQRQYVLDNLTSLVVRPIDRELGGSVLGSELSAQQVETLRERIASSPHLYVGQEVLPLSQMPTLTPGGVRPRPVSLRMFGVSSGADYQIMPGGLARVPAEPDTLVVDPLAGPPQDAALLPITPRRRTVSKDVWVLRGEEAHAPSAGWLADGPIAPTTDPFLAMSPRMLSDLFWIGRYSVRAEDLVRLILSVREITGNLHSTPDGEAGEALRRMRSTITQASTTYPGFLDESTDPRAELHSLMTDVRRPGTVAQALDGLHTALQGVRDQFSNDVWLVLNMVDRALRDLSRVPHDDGTLLVSCAERSLTGLLGLSGVLFDNMTHDPGWHLLNSGRAIERALQVLAVLRSSVCVQQEPGTDSLVIEAVLKASESLLTYRRRYRGRTHVEGVLSLVLLDVHNPRSVLAQMRTLAAQLPLFGAEDSDELTGEVDAIISSMEALDPVVLAQLSPDGTREALHAKLGELYDAVGAVAAHVSDRYLTTKEVQREMFEGVAIRGEAR